MSLFGAIGISASGMSAERLRMDVTAENLANADSTKGANGQPYQRQEVVLAAGNPSFSQVLGKQQAGVRVDSINIAGSALSAERLRMDVTAENLANANTTRGANGEAYRRKVVVREPQQAGASFGTALASEMRRGQKPSGVQVAAVAEDTTPNRRVYEPGHPDADAQGYVERPNVDTVTEMVDLISASRTYEANVTAMQSAKMLFAKTLELLR